MLSRKEQNNSAILFPDEWVDKVKKILDSVYLEKCAKIEKEFQIFGFTYPDELVLAVSLVNPSNDAVIPVSYIMSADLDEKNQAEAMLNDMVDSIGNFFDIYFADKDWMDYSTRWEEVDFKNTKFFYQITRENIKFSIMADALLNK